MKKSSIQRFICIFLVFGHLLITAYIVYLSKTRLHEEEMWDLLNTVAPLFSTYLIVAIKTIFSLKNIKIEEKKDASYIFVVTLYPIVFVSSIFAVLYAYQEFYIESFISLQKAVRGIEITFGLYFGVTMDILFSSKRIA